MATKILNRRELRAQGEAAELSAEVAGGPEVANDKPGKAKTPRLAKPRKARAKKLPPRMCARWGIFDSAMKQVAVFDYNQRPLADQKLADLLANKKGYFMQVVKEAMAEVIVADGPALK